MTYFYSTNLLVKIAFSSADVNYYFPRKMILMNKYFSQHGI